MDEIRLSIMDRGPAFSAAFRQILDDFERSQSLHVHLEMLPWLGAWETLVKIGTYGDGPQISELGSTWLGDLVGMNTLQPISASDLDGDGAGKAAFLLPSWQAASLAGSPDASPAGDTWAVPFTVDPRIIYYRSDHLAEAGIDPVSAFSTANALAATLAGLQSSGNQAAWVVPSHSSRLTLHNLSSWVWGAGGSFMTPDMKLTAFASPASLAGITEYFQLARYIAVSQHGLVDDDASQTFYRGAASVTIAGPWLHNTLDALPGKVGRSLPPGVAFIGGTHLVIWRHARRQRQLLNLIQYLTSAGVQLALFKDGMALPSRPDVLAQEPFASDPFNIILSSRLQTARSFPLFRLWGMVEKRLTAAMTTIWQKTLQPSTGVPVLPDAEIASLVAETLQPLARRLDVTLAS